MSTLTEKELERQLERRDAHIITLEKQINALAKNCRDLELALGLAVKLHDKLIGEV